MSSISNVGGYGSSMMSAMNGGTQRMQRPDPSRMAEELFSKLDTKGQGYVEKSDMQSAFDQLPSTGNSGDAASVDEIFNSLDGDGDGKITKEEMSSGLQKIADELDSQFNKMREGGMKGAGGMPPPPQDADDAGFTQEELASQLEEIGTADSKRASLISNIVDNFEEADSDGDGKVSFKEAMAFDQASQSGTADKTSSSSSDSGTSSASDSNKLEAQIMKQIMDLMRTYGEAGSSGTASLFSSLAVSA